MKDSASHMKPTWDTTGRFPSTLVPSTPPRKGTNSSPENRENLKGNESFSNHQCSGDVLVFRRVVHKENKVAFNVGMKW